MTDARLNCICSKYTTLRHSTAAKVLDLNSYFCGNAVPNFLKIVLLLLSLLSRDYHMMCYHCDQINQYSLGIMLVCRGVQPPLHWVPALASILAPGKHLL